jgi:hypothetical protein
MIKFFSYFDKILIKFLHNFLKEKKLYNFFSDDNTGIFKKCNFDEINLDLNKKGYYIFSDLLPIKDVEYLKFKICNLKGKYKSDYYFSKNLEYFDIKSPKGTKFDYDSSQLLELKEIQDILLDKNLLKIVQNYFSSLPKIDIVSAWWSVPSTKPDHNAAQLWHFDMDRPKWLKVFIFLTDCNLNNGPHSFIEGTHRKNGIPYKIRSKGYVRIEDHDVETHYKKDKIIQFTAKKGTILLEDTIGLHKGLKLESGSRLLLQFQYSSSLFGSHREQIKYPKNLTKSFIALKNQNIKIFDNFIY